MKSTGGGGREGGREGGRKETEFKLFDKCERGVEAGM